jgi:hypothetical protein
MTVSANRHILSISRNATKSKDLWLSLILERGSRQDGLKPCANFASLPVTWLE